MRPGQSIEIQLADEGGNSIAIGNVMIQLRFFTKGNFRYEFEAGRTNNSGRLVVSYDQMEGLRRKRSEEFVMDYNTKLEDCDAAVVIAILTEEELRKRRDQVLRSYALEPEWAKSWPSNARIKAEPKSVELSRVSTNVDIQVTRV